MESRIFTEENGGYQIDFRNAICATNQLKSIFDESKVVFCDVDFIAKTPEAMLFIEYKNAIIP